MTITTPVGILAFVTIFATLGFADMAGNDLAALQVGLGVFAGSTSWWFLLTGGLSLLRKRFRLQGLQWGTTD